LSASTGGKYGAKHFILCELARFLLFLFFAIDAIVGSILALYVLIGALCVDMLADTLRWLGYVYLYL
jgi:hypothetical protein